MGEPLQQVTPTRWKFSLQSKVYLGLMVIKSLLNLPLLPSYAVERKKHMVGVNTFEAGDLPEEEWFVASMQT